MKPWPIISIVLAVVVILLLVFRKEPKYDSSAWKESLRRSEEKLKANKVVIDSLAEMYRLILNDKTKDSIEYLRKINASEVKISRLNKKLSEINTSTATAPQLDSIISVLYP